MSSIPIEDIEAAFKRQESPGVGAIDPDEVDDAFRRLNTSRDKPLPIGQRLERSPVGEFGAAVARGGLNQLQEVISFRDMVNRNIEAGVADIFGFEVSDVSERPEVRAIRHLLETDTFRKSDAELEGGTVGNPRWWISVFGENLIPLSTQIASAKFLPKILRSTGSSKVFKGALGFAGPAAIASAGGAYQRTINELMGDDSLSLTPREIVAVGTLEGLAHGFTTAATNIPEFTFILGKAPGAGIMAMLVGRATIAQGLMQAGRAGLAEAIQEPLEGTFQDLITMGRRAKLGQPIDDLLDGFLRRRGLESIAAFPLGVVTSGAMDVAGLPKLRRQIREDVAAFAQRQDEDIDSLLQRGAILRQIEQRIQSEDASPEDIRTMRAMVEDLMHGRGIDLEATVDVEGDFPSQRKAASNPFRDLVSHMDEIFATRNTILNRLRNSRRRLNSKLSSLKKDVSRPDSPVEASALFDQMQSLDQQISDIQSQIQVSQVDIVAANRLIDDTLSQSDIPDAVKERLLKIKHGGNRRGIQARSEKIIQAFDSIVTKQARDGLRKALPRLQKKISTFQPSVREKFQPILDSLQPRKLTPARRKKILDQIAEIESDPDITIPSIVQPAKALLSRGTPDDLTADEAVALTDAIVSIIRQQSKERQKALEEREKKVLKDSKEVYLDFNGSQDINPEGVQPVKHYPLTTGKGGREIQTFGQQKASQFKKFSFGMVENLMPKQMIQWLANAKETVAEKVLYRDVADSQNAFFQLMIESNEHVFVAMGKAGATRDQVKRWGSSIAAGMFEGNTFGIIPGGKKMVDKGVLTIRRTSRGADNKLVTKEELIEVEPDQKMELAAILMDRDGAKWLLNNKVEVHFDGHDINDRFVVDRELARNLFNPNHPNGLSREQLIVLKEMFRYVNTTTRNVFSQWSLETRGEDTAQRFLYWPIDRFLPGDIGVPSTRAKGETSQEQQDIGIRRDISKFVLESAIPFDRSRKGGHDPIRVGSFFRTYQSHTHMVNGLATIGPSIQHASRVLSQPELRVFLREKLDGRVAKRFDDIYVHMANEIANRPMIRSGIVRDLVRGATSTIVRGVLGLDPRIAIGQVVSIIQASTHPDFEFADIWSNTSAAFDKSIDEEIRQWASRLHYRALYTATGFLVEGGSFGEPVAGFTADTDLPMMGIRSMDNSAIRIIWRTAHDVAIQEAIDAQEGDGEVDPNNEDVMLRTAQLAEEVVNDTQPTADPLHISQLALEAKSDPLIKLFVVFRSQLSKNLSIVLESIDRVGKDINDDEAWRNLFKTLIASTAMWIMVKWLFNVAARNTVRAAQGRELSLLRADEDVDDLARKLGPRMIESMASLPIGGSFFAPIITAPLKDRYFNPEISPVLAIMEDAAESAARLTNSVGTGKDLATIGANLIDLSLDASVLAGVPAAGPSRLIKDILRDQESQLKSF